MPAPRVGYGLPSQAAIHVATYQRQRTLCTNWVDVLWYLRIFIYAATVWRLCSGNVVATSTNTWDSILVSADHFTRAVSVSFNYFFLGWPNPNSGKMEEKSVLSRGLVLFQCNRYRPQSRTFVAASVFNSFWLPPLPIVVSCFAMSFSTIAF